MIVYVKDPDTNKDYGWDWTDFLGADTIATSSWESSPSGLTLSDDDFNGPITSTFIADGTEGEIYTVTNRITTAAGRIDDRSFRIRIAQQ